MRPALSVVVATRSGWAPLRTTIACLSEQTIAHRIELVVASLDGEPRDDPPAAVAALAAHRVVVTTGSVADANAAGARGATADVVAFGEDHAFPVAEWAEALVARHAEPWACVGAVVRNANPGTAVSWADYAIGYAAYAEGHAGGEVRTAPGHNSSYKRDVLLREPDLETALQAEWVFHLRLRDRGERICLEPRAIVRHVNFGMLRPFLTVTFRHALVGGGARAAGWPLARRAAYALGAPLIPALRLARIARALPAPLRRRVPRRAWLILAAGLAIDAAGQAAGFLGGDSPRAGDELATLELERVRYIPAAEAASLP